MLNLDFEAQVRGSTFTLCHDHLKKAISLGKLQKVGLFCKGLYIVNILTLTIKFHMIAALFRGTVPCKKTGLFGVFLMKWPFSNGRDRE